MSQSIQKVLSKLKRNSRKGVCHWDFGTGFALRSRIADLRARGLNIITKMERNSNNRGSHARYFLVGQK